MARLSPCLDFAALVTVASIQTVAQPMMNVAPQ
jgi:hypothetical protein